MSTDAPNFTLTVDQNPHLAVGVRTVHAIVEVRSTEAQVASAAGPPDAAEVIILDRSSSMSGRKIEQARAAAAAAIDVLRDGVYFAVVAGQSTAMQVYPPKGPMVRAGKETRTAAKRALRHVRADGGTRMSSWLRLALGLFDGCPADLKHAVMLTDGHNIERPDLLAGALEECRGRFVCDCRGVGDEWSLTQIKEITGALLGDWKPIAAAEQLADDFRAVMARSMDKRVTDVKLRVRCAPTATVTHFARVMPTIEELTDKGVPQGNGRVLEFPLGSWGTEERAYDLRIDLSQQELQIEDDTRAKAAAVEIVVPAPGGGSVVAARGSVFAEWTVDVALSGRINEAVAGYSGQEELAKVVNGAIRAWEQGAADVTEQLGRAVQLAHRLGRDDVLEHLSRAADIEDPETGRVRPLPPRNVPRSDLHLSSWLFGAVPAGR